MTTESERIVIRELDKIAEYHENISGKTNEEQKNHSIWGYTLRELAKILKSRL